jgi:fructosamine-3-kinase
VRGASAIGGQHGVLHYRVTLADGRPAFAKVAQRTANPAAAESAAAGFTAEASSLRFLAEADAVGVPEALGCSDNILLTEWIPEQPADLASAARFGRGLANLHQFGADSFGAPWPGVLAGLPLPNDTAASWPGWFAECRLLPFARLARNAGNLTSSDISIIETIASRIAELAGPAEPPSRIHGDCWSGNVLWSGGRGWLIDPAAHGGHRETDLAMLALFGAPHLDQIIAAYQETAPLADGWQTRVPLHQLHPLLVHVCLFGSSYRDSALSAARRALKG